MSCFKIFSFIGSLLFSLLFLTAETPAQEHINSVGQLKAEVPPNIEINEPFSIDIWFEPNDSKFSKTVTVYMDQAKNIQYDPRVFQFEPKKKKTIRARLIKSRSGLAVIKANSIGCTSLEKVLNAGFPLKFSAPELEKPIERGVTFWTIVFADNSGKPIPLDATVSFHLRAYNAYFRTRSNNLSREVVFDSERGTDSSQTLQIEPSSLWESKGRVDVVAIINENELLHSETIRFTILPSQTVLFFMAIVGGILYSLYLISKEIMEVPSPVKWFFSRGLLKIVAGFITGSLAYFLAEWDVLGIKVDTTTYRGFVILGFLFSYVGIDTILKKISERKKTSENK